MVTADASRKRDGNRYSYCNCDYRTRSMSCEFFLDALDQCHSIAIRARRAYELLNEGSVPRTRATDGEALYSQLGVVAISRCPRRSGV